MEAGAVTRVLKDVFTTVEGELCLSKGDILQVIKQVDKYWCYGNAYGKVGLFPTDQLMPLETPPLNDGEELFLAIADFLGEQQGDLKFRKGEFIIGERKLDEHWWEGRTNERCKGVFPDTFTWHLSITQQTNQKKSNKLNLRARVKMSLKAQLDEEMDLHVGDILTIIDEPDKGWYKGICEDRCGIFPSAYVTLLDEPTCSPDYVDKCNVESTAIGVNNELATLKHAINSKPLSNGDDVLHSNDLMTFSPEKEVKPIEITPSSVLSDMDILNDDYFKMNMPSIYSGREERTSSFAVERSNASSSYLTELVDELDDCKIQPYGVTLYPFYAQYSNELSFHENEIVHLIRYVDDDWLEGEIDGRKGIFPVNYINIIVNCGSGWRSRINFSEDSVNPQTIMPRSYAKVLYNFDAQMTGDLSVREGDIVMVMKLINSDWCEVRNQSGNTGQCPSNHLTPHSISPTGALFRSSSFSSNLEPVFHLNKPASRTFEPDDFSAELRKKDKKLDDLISKNLSGLEILPVKRRSPLEMASIDFKEELNVLKVAEEGNDKPGDICSKLVTPEKCEEQKLPDISPLLPSLPPKPSLGVAADTYQVSALGKDAGTLSMTGTHNLRGSHQADDCCAPPTPKRPERPPPPSRRPSIDRAPHRPAPPVPIAGQTPVRKSLRRLPRQTSAPCVLSDDPNNVEEVKEFIRKKEKQLQELQMVHEEIESELEHSQENESRIEELRQCSKVYEKRMRRLKKDIQHFHEKLDKVEVDSAFSQDEFALEKCNELKRRKIMEQRQNVISELVMTEKEYVRDLKLTYEVFDLHNPTKLEERGIDVKALFGNILDVMHAAEEFLDSLHLSMKGLKEEEQCVGPVFLKHADHIKRVYSEYCANHENALCLLEKYKTIPAAQAMFDKAMETLRYQITCFNVGSVLIKPVQRLLKYPLILNELIKCTEDQHMDKMSLLKAVKVYTDMASDINEYKRRKDIVSKYLGDGTSTLARKMAKLNLHSVAKKSSRLSAKLSSTLGLSMAPKDEQFLEEERSFHSLERTIRTFLRNLEILMNYLDEEVQALFHLGEVLAVYYMNRKKDRDVDEFRTTQRLIMGQFWVEFKTVVDSRVSAPLLSLIELFQGPCKLIEKRNDKLLDYDNCLAKADKSKENRQFQDELFKSRNNYEALNQQLLEDLPILIKTSTEIFLECLRALMAAQKLFSGKITKQYLSLLDVPSLASAAGDAVEAFSVKHYLVCNQLGRFSFSSKSFRESGGNKKSMKTSPTPVRQLGTDGQKLDQSASQRAYLQGRYPVDKLFCTINDYEASGPLDLALSKGNIVAVIKKQDPSGSTLRWFVDNGVAQGFVQRSCLEPLSSPRNSLSPSSSTNSSRSSCNTPSPREERASSALSRKSDEKDVLSNLKTSERQKLNHLKLNNEPPSYEEVTCSLSQQAIYDEVPVETQHRYEDISDELPSCNSQQFSKQTLNEVETPDDLESLDDSEFYFSVFEFAGMGAHTMPLKEGQVVNVLEKQDLHGNNEWWFVENRYGKKGYVPANYLHPYSEPS